MSGNLENKPWINYNEWLFFQEYKSNPLKYRQEYMEQIKNTRINYIPSFKGIVVSQYVRPELLVFKEKSKIILPTEVSDRELQKLGLDTKGAVTANAGSENQESFIIEAIGLKVDTDEFKLGDKVYLRHAAQPLGLEIDGKFYGQIHEYEIAGKLL